MFFPGIAGIPVSTTAAGGKQRQYKAWSDHLVKHRIHDVCLCLRLREEKIDHAFAGS